MITKFRHATERREKIGGYVYRLDGAAIRGSVRLPGARYVLLVLGICNGFQVLCEAGLLPGALLRNEDLRFLCRQVDLIDADGATLSIPVKHGEGRYYAPPETLDRIEVGGQVAFRYAPGQNPNGSARDIAGVRNEAGNVVGLMPHPEHAVDPLTGSTDGLHIFRRLAELAAAPAAPGRGSEGQSISVSSGPSESRGGGG